MKPTTEILLSAAFALTPPENWNQGRLGLDRDGVYVEPTSRLAVSWCALGAIDAAGGNRKELTTIAAVSALANVIPRDADEGARWAVARFNNTHAHAEVLDALYRAAEIAESA